MAQQSGRDLSAYPPFRLLTGGLLVRVQPGELRSTCKAASTTRAPREAFPLRIEHGPAHVGLYGYVVAWAAALVTAYRPTFRSATMYTRADKDTRLLALFVVAHRILRHVRPAVQVSQDVLVELARKRHGLDPRDLLTGTHACVEKSGHCSCVVLVSKGPRRLVAGRPTRVENDDGDVGHFQDVMTVSPKRVSLV